MRCPECSKQIDDDASTCRFCGYSIIEEHSTQNGSDKQRDPKETTTLTSDKHREDTEELGRIGKYEVIELLGRGATAKVYLAQDPVLNRRVAVKTMIAGEDASEEAVIRFMTEARSAAKLQHPHITGIHEVGQSRSRHYMVMDYIRGRPLSDIIENERLSNKEIAKIVRDVARALDYSHSKGVIHRDVKPANIMIQDDGTVKVMDFGLARNLDEDKSVTRSGAIMGSPAYLNPEQASGRPQDVDARSDVYSLGAVMYEMLTGRPPAQGKSLMKVVSNVLDSEPVKPSRIRVDIDRELEIICSKAMFKEPEHRYQSAGALADDLQRYIDNEPIDARPASLVYKLRKKISRNKELSVAFFVLLISTVVGLHFWIEHQKVLKEKVAAESDKEKIRKQLAAKEQAEQSGWMTMYEETFDRIGELGPKWDTAEAGEIRNNALFIDGKGGGTVVWLDIPITGEDWRFEYDGWVAKDAEYINDIGLFVKADKDADRWKSGFEVQFGGRKNRISGIIYKGEDIYTEENDPTIQKGHVYHFEITYRDGVLTYVALDKDTKTYIFNRSRKVPDINIVREKQRQGFWTWDSQIYIDNVRISKLGVPERRTYLDVARDFLDVAGVHDAVGYLIREMEKRESRSERITCYNTIVKFCLNASIKEKKALAPDVVRVYFDHFSGTSPADLLEKDLINGFYGMYYDNRETFPEEYHLTDDPGYRQFIRTVQQHRFQKQISYARNLIEAGLFSQGLTVLDDIHSSAEQDFPQQALDALFLIAHYSCRKGNFDKAEKTLQEVLERSQEYPVLRVRILREFYTLYSEKGQPQKGITYLERILREFDSERFDNDHAFALMHMGRFYRSIGDYTKTEEFLKTIIEKYPAQREFAGLAVRDLAVMFGMKGNNEQARNYWKKLAHDYREAGLYCKGAQLITGDLSLDHARALFSREKAEAEGLFFEAEKMRIHGNTKDALELFKKCSQRSEPDSREFPLPEAAFWIKQLSSSAKDSNE